MSPLTDYGKELIAKWKRLIGTFFGVMFFALWLNPIRMIHRKLRWGTIVAFWNALTAPFGDVNFKAYLFAEILTDSIIQLEDIGKVTTQVVTGQWNNHMISES